MYPIWLIAQQHETYNVVDVISPVWFGFVLGPWRLYDVVQYCRKVLSKGPSESRLNNHKFFFANQVAVDCDMEIHQALLSINNVQRAL